MRAQYTLADDTVTAQGNVHINRGGNIYQGAQLKLQVDAFQGTSPKRPTSFWTPRAMAMPSASSFSAASARPSTRPPTPPASAMTATAGPPTRVLQAQRIELDRATDTGVAHGGVLKFKGIPLLPVPRVSFPLSDKRKSGLLPPTIGIDSVSGFEVSLPYYWNIAPNRDATLTPTLMSKRGVNLGSEFRYLERDFSGDLDPRPHAPTTACANATAGRYAWRNQADSSPLVAGLNADWKIHRVSDNDYWRDFSLPSRRWPDQ